MKRRVLLMLLFVACDQAEVAQQEEADLLGGPGIEIPIGPTPPPVLEDESQLRSGVKLIRPRVLQKVLENSFSSQVYSALSEERYTVLLGGLDYLNVNTRTEFLTPSMALVMFEVSKGQCASMIEGATEFSYLRASPYDDPSSLSAAQIESAIDTMHRLLRGRPIDADTLVEASAVFDAAVDEGLSSTVTYQGVCSFLFLHDGGFLLY